MRARKSKRRKTLLQEEKNNSEEVNAGDRISSLPNGILQHIQSFLPTHCVVQTCVLSKRWRYIWTGVPRLDLDGMNMYYNEIYKHINFMNFAEKAVRLHDAPILNKFRLVIDESYKSKRSRIRSLISTVLKRRKVLKLSLDIGIDSFIVFPPSLYVCESLTSLKLHGTFSTLKFPASVCFPNLEFMCLTFINISCKEGVGHVTLSCPALEEAKFIDCEWCDIKTMDIFAPKLVMMTIKDIENEWNTNCEINFYAECLVTLEVFSCLTFELNFHNLLSLYDATLYIDSGENDNSHRVSKLIQAVSNVKELILYYPTILKFSSAKHLLAFSQLQNLIVPKSRFSNGESLTKLFCSLPLLKSLIFMNGLGKYSHEGYDWSLEAVPQSFLLHLKSFEINGFYGNETELSLVEFLLKNTMAKISIVSSPKLSSDPKKQLEVTKRLLNLYSNLKYGGINFT